MSDEETRGFFITYEVDLIKKNHFIGLFTVLIIFLLVANQCIILCR